MNKPQFVYVTYIATTPEKLWQALTSAEFTRQYWFGRDVESEWKVSAAIVLRYDNGRKIDIQGQILRCEPPRLLSYTFGLDANESVPEEQRRERPSRVTYQIEPMDGSVRLTVTHDDFDPDSEVLPRISRGWPAILSGLKTVLESGRSLVFSEAKFRAQ